MAYPLPCLCPDRLTGHERDLEPNAFFAVPSSDVDDGSCEERFVFQIAVMSGESVGTGQRVVGKPMFSFPSLPLGKRFNTYGDRRNAAEPK